MGWPHAIDELRAADVMHRHLSALPADTSVDAVRAYFAESASRRLAVITDDGRFLGSLDRDALPDDAPGSAAAAGYAADTPIVGPQTPAVRARALALAASSSRLPVVDATGRLVGIVAVNHLRDGFCGLPAAEAGSPPPA